MESNWFFLMGEFMKLFGSLVESWFIHSFSLLTVVSFLPPGCNSRTQNFPLNSLCRFSQTLLSELLLQEGFCCLKISKLSRIKCRLLNLRLSSSIHFGGCKLPMSSPMRGKKPHASESLLVTVGSRGTTLQPSFILLGSGVTARCREHLCNLVRSDEHKWHGEQW